MEGEKDIAKEAVLVHSEPLPKETPTVQGTELVVTLIADDVSAALL